MGAEAILIAVSNRPTRREFRRRQRGLARCEGVSRMTRRVAVWDMPKRGKWCYTYSYNSGTRIGSERRFRGVRRKDGGGLGTIYRTLWARRIVSSCFLVPCKHLKASIATISDIRGISACSYYFYAGSFDFVEQLSILPSRLLAPWHQYQGVLTKTENLTPEITEKVVSTGTFSATFLTKNNILRNSLPYYVIFLVFFVGSLLKRSRKRVAEKVPVEMTFSVTFPALFTATKSLHPPCSKWESRCQYLVRVKSPSPPLHQRLIIRDRTRQKRKLQFVRDPERRRINTDALVQCGNTHNTGRPDNCIISSPPRADAVLSLYASHLVPSLGSKSRSRSKGHYPWPSTRCARLVVTR